MTSWDTILGGGIITPTHDPEAAHFWAALDDGLVLVSACGNCGHRWFPPMETCPRCASRAVTSEPASTTGRLYSWTVIHRAADPVYAPELPYVVGLVELGDSSRLYGRVVGVAPDALVDGLELCLCVTRVDGQSIWYFRNEKCA